MTDSERIAGYLQHILDAIDRATTYANKAVTFAVFEQDVLLQDGVIRNIGVIGEAAVKIGQVAPELVALHSRIPWREMQTMRHKLVHDYFDVDLAVVWETVQRDLSPLTREVRQLLTILESGQLPRPP
jgi:uncharacterized protein with HEPN domain